MNIYCIIPAYNEEKNLAGVLKNVKKTGINIVVVDDGSTDNTFDLAIKSEVNVLKHVVNRGQGAALKTGTEYAIRNNADIIVHFDADGQFLAEDIAAVVLPIEKNEADIVFGSRFMGIESNMPRFKKKIIMPLARLVNRVFLDVKLTDPQSGFRAMSIIAAKKFSWQQNGMAHASEILFAANKAGLRIKEVPIKVVYHDFGQKISGGIKIIKDLFLARLIN